MTKFAALFPRGNCGRVSLSVVVVSTSVQPMSVPVNMEFIEIPELVQRMMLQVVRHDHIISCRLWFVLKSVEI